LTAWYIYIFYFVTEIVIFLYFIRNINLSINRNTHIQYFSSTNYFEHFAKINKNNGK